MSNEVQIVVSLLTALRAYANGIVDGPELAKSVINEWEDFVSEKERSNG